MLRISDNQLKSIWHIDDLHIIHTLRFKIYDLPVLTTFKLFQLENILCLEITITLYQNCNSSKEQYSWLIWLFFWKSWFNPSFPDVHSCFTLKISENRTGIYINMVLRIDEMFVYLTQDWSWIFFFLNKYPNCKCIKDKTNHTYVTGHKATLMWFSF